MANRVIPLQYHFEWKVSHFMTDYNELCLFLNDMESEGWEVYAINYNPDNTYDGWHVILRRAVENALPTEPRPGIIDGVGRDGKRWSNRGVRNDSV